MPPWELTQKLSQLKFCNSNASRPSSKRAKTKVKSTRISWNLIWLDMVCHFKLCFDMLIADKFKFIIHSIPNSTPLHHLWEWTHQINPVTPSLNLFLKSISTRLYICSSVFEEVFLPLLLPLYYFLLLSNNLPELGLQ